MTQRAAPAALLLALCLLGGQARAQSLPPELQTTLPQAALSGQATMVFWGFDVYQARLWVTPGFADTAYAQSPFALELRYQRSFKGADIAKRSLSEMRRQGPMDDAQAQRWEAAMQALFPDVKAGDRITGVHQPQTGAQFWNNGRWLGEVRDLEFSKRFFGIWLSAQTSEPQLRQSLLQARAPSGVAP